MVIGIIIGLIPMALWALALRSLGQAQNTITKSQWWFGNGMRINSDGTEVIAEPLRKREERGNG